MASSSSADSVPPRAKRQRSEAKLLTIRLHGPGGSGVSVSVLPSEKGLTVQEWLRRTVEPADGAWAELSVSHHVDFEAPVRLSDTLESLGLFTKQNDSIVLDVSHWRPGGSGAAQVAAAQLQIPNPRRQLHARVAQTDWGMRISAETSAVLALSRAIDKAVTELSESDVEDRLKFVRQKLRGKPSRWTVELEASMPSEHGAPMFQIGDEMSLTIRCIDAIGLSADVKAPTSLSVRVRFAAHSRTCPHLAVLGSDSPRCPCAGGSATCAWLRI